MREQARRAFFSQRGNAPVTQREFSRSLDRKNSLEFAGIRGIPSEKYSSRRRSPRGLPFNFFSRQRRRSIRHARGRARDSRRESSSCIVKECLAMRHFLAVSRRARLLGALDSARTCISFFRYLSGALEIPIGDPGEIRNHSRE